MANGTEKAFLFISSMGDTGFVLSPLVENTAEFALLFEGLNAMKSKVVQSIKIYPRRGTALLWKESFRLSLMTFDKERRENMLEVFAPQDLLADVAK